MRNLGEMVPRNAKYYPNKVGVICEDKRFTWEAFNERVNKLTHHFSEIGLTKGDCISVLSYNCSEYLEIYCACFKGGFIIVPLNFRSVGKELLYLIENSQAKVLIFGSEFIDAVRAIKSELSEIVSFVCIGQRVDFAQDYEKLIAHSDHREPEVDVSPDDIAYIFYTSGTTGFPKGAMHTHKGQLDHIRDTIIEVQLTHQDVHLVNVPPMFHLAGMVWLLPHLYLGGTVVISKFRGFDPKGVLELIEREKVTNIHLVPVTIMALVDYADLRKFDYGSIKSIYYATAPMPVNYLRKAIDLFGHVFIQCFGQTESGPTITILKKEDHRVEGLTDDQASRRLASCGKVAVGTWMKLVDENDEEVPAGVIGEIVTKSGKIMKGYWGGPEETNHALRNGWLHTGDLGTYDENGFVYIVDRKKDMIITGGENVYPAELERVIYSHPAVDSVAVIGVPDDIWGEAVKAVIVLKEGMRTSEEEIIDLCKRNLASYKKPKSVEFVGSLPRSPAGKILKRVLKEKYWEGRERKIV